MAEAFKSGELDDSYFLIIDKGGCSLTLYQTGPEEGVDERYDRCQEIFEWEFDNPVGDLLQMAGIPSEWC